MNKKIYTSPRSEVVTFHTESLMPTTSSMDQHDDIELGGSSALSNEHGWSSDNWTAADED